MKRKIRKTALFAAIGIAALVGGWFYGGCPALSPEWAMKDIEKSHFVEDAELILLDEYAFSLGNDLGGVREMFGVSRDGEYTYCAYLRSSDVMIFNPLWEAYSLRAQPRGGRIDYVQGTYLWMDDWVAQPDGSLLNMGGANLPVYFFDNEGEAASAGVLVRCGGMTFETMTSRVGDGFLTLFGVNGLNREHKDEIRDILAGVEAGTIPAELEIYLFDESGEEIYRETLILNQK